MTNSAPAGSMSSNRVAPPNGGTTTLELAFEKHYTPQELAELWGVSANTVRRMFSGELGVLEFGSDETRWSRKRKVMRIPASVVLRIHSTNRN
jgi:hypothetical protein